MKNASILCACVCVGYRWYQKPEILEFGKAFVSVTQHTVPHAQEINVYPLQHNQASTTPPTPPAYVFMNTQVLTIGSRASTLPLHPLPHPRQSDTPDAPCVMCCSTRSMSVGGLVCIQHQSSGELLSRSLCGPQVSVPLISRPVPHYH